jgi:hypothetical protein
MATSITMLIQTSLSRTPPRVSSIFLFLNANAQLIGTALGPVVPAVHGASLFNTEAVGELGVQLVSQLPNGQIDLLAFDGAGHLIRSDLIANTVGLPPVVGAATGSNGLPIFQGVGALGEGSIVTQLPNGSIDVIGFSGDFSAPGGVTMSASFLIPGTAGSPQLFALDQDFHTAFQWDTNVPSVDGTFRDTVEMVGQLPNGQIDLLFFNSGYNDAANRGVEFATLAENFAVPAGWHIVDAGIVAHDLFPVLT